MILAHLLSLFASVVPCAQEIDVEGILQKLEESSAQLKSFTAAYRQVEVDEFGDSTSFSGTIYFLKEMENGEEVGFFKMTSEVGGKVVEEVGTNGTQGWMVRHSIKRVEVVSMSAINRRTGGITVTGAADMLRTNHEIVFRGIEELPTGPAYHIFCEPKKGATAVDPMMISLDLWISTEHPAPIAKILLKQRNGITSTWELGDVRRNVRVDRGIFKKKVPRGYEEIKHE